MEKGNYLTDPVDFHTYKRTQPEKRFFTLHY